MVTDGEVLVALNVMDWFEAFLQFQLTVETVVYDAAHLTILVVVVVHLDLIYLMYALLVTGL